MTYQDTPFEPDEQRKARELKEQRTLQLYSHIFQSACAMIEAQIYWRDGIHESSEYKALMTNQLRSIIYNLVELKIGKRPGKLG